MTKKEFIAENLDDAKAGKPVAGVDVEMYMGFYIPAIKPESKIAKTMAYWFSAKVLTGRLAFRTPESMLGFLWERPFQWRSEAPIEADDAYRQQLVSAIASEKETLDEIAQDIDCRLAWMSWNDMRLFTGDVSSDTQHGECCVVGTIDAETVPEELADELIWSLCEEVSEMYNLEDGV